MTQQIQLAKKGGVVADTDNDSDVCYRLPIRDLDPNKPIDSGVNRNAAQCILINLENAICQRMIIPDDQWEDTDATETSATRSTAEGFRHMLYFKPDGKGGGEIQGRNTVHKRPRSKRDDG